MRVRTATLADTSTIAHIHVKTWQAAYRGQMPDALLAALDEERRAAFWRERIAQSKGLVLVAESGGGLTGFCDLIPSRDVDADPKTTGEIAAIYVLPQHWRKGAGRALCEGALAAARKENYTAVTLWVLASNSPAKHFYKAMSFRPDGAAKTERTSDGHELQEIRFHLAIQAS
jgi:ribosomal protein S18 acetylase RimI-like enzyme